MTRRSKVWLVVGVLFTVGNLVGGVVAALDGELLHTGAHAGLALLGAYLVWRLTPRRRTGGIWGREESVTAELPLELTDRLTHLEQSLHAVAIKVERVGEGQRFMTRVLAENSTPQAAGEGAAEPIEIKPRR